MKIGCGEWGFRELPMEEHFKIATKLGFRHLEFGIGGNQIGRLPAEFGSMEAANFRAVARDYHIETPACCLENDFTLPDPDQHQKMLRTVVAQMRLASTCGAKQIRLFAGFTPAFEMTEALWQQMLAAFHEVAVLASELKATIAIETHGRITLREGAAHHDHTVTTEPRALQRLLRELPKTIGFNYDPGNLKAVAPHDETYSLPLLNNRVTYCHLKDWKKVRNGWEACAIGDDDLDYGPLLRALHFDGVYYIEYEPTSDPEGGIQRSLNYLRVRLAMNLEFV